ncbi:MAG: cupin domain-containing protein [Bacteroidetes bacterium]|jgi:quercetin dioxygenase-like cupin family protein|nr:cupin domain-containing protein [Bacteroidota bacterium]MDF1867393.1 cupin domain-containing protein [Saprospiraceae bacterium]
MNRKDFLKSATLSAGALAVSSVSLAKSNNQNSLVKSDKSNQLEPRIIRIKEGKKQIVLGDHQTIKLSGKDTNGQFTLIEEYNNPGVEIPMHVHANEDEVFHVLSGELQIKVGNETKLLKAGDMGFCPRGIPHSWKVVGDKKAKVMLSIFPAGLEVMFRELAVLPAGPPDFEKIAKICSNYNIQFV